MARGTTCIHGRTDDGTAGGCPLCGPTGGVVVEETMVPDRPMSAPAGEGTIVGPPAVQSPAATPPESVEAMLRAFLAQPANNDPATLDGSLPAPVPPTSHDETMQKPPTPSGINGRSTHAPAVAPTAPVAAAPTRPDEPAEPGGETLVKPSGMEVAAPDAPTRPDGKKRASAPVAPVVGGYEVLGLLGRGGMGVVYKARQVGLNRVVALKMILSGGHASPQELERFRREATAVARLNHPNIIRIFEIGERDGRPFFSLEYCEGGSLQQLLDGTPMEPRRAAELVASLAGAVEYAHANKVVHRDLKPANILLDADRRPKITDFGLAKLLESDDGNTATEAVLGTPTYMAPEQAMGKTRDAGPAADIYSLGAIFYDLLTGRPPFKGSTALDTLQMVQTNEPIPPARLNTKVPTDLQTICLRCLEKDPAKRFPSAGDLAADLRRWLDGLPISARPASSIERGIKWARRNPSWAALLVGAVVGPLAIAAVSVGYSVTLANANAKIKSQSVELADEKAVIEDQAKELEKKNVVLNRQKDDITRKEVELRASFNKLDDAYKQLATTEQAARQNFLAAQDAAEDLLRLARESLRTPGTEGVRAAVLRRAVEMCRRFAVVKTDDEPISLYRSARASRMVGDLEGALNDTAASVAAHRKAVEIFARLRADEASGRFQAPPAADLTRELLETYVQLWPVLERVGSAEADGVLGDGFALLASVSPGVRSRPEYRRLEALLTGDRAIREQRRGAVSRALADYDAAVSLLDGSGTSDSSRVELARFLTNRAAVRLDAMGWWAEPVAARAAKSADDAGRAVELLAAILKTRDDLGVAIELGRAYGVMATAKGQGGQAKAAVAVCESAVDVFRRLSQRSPQAIDPKHLLALARGNLGTQLISAGDFVRSGAELAAARDELSKLADAYRSIPVYALDLGRQQMALGALAVQSRAPADALARFEEARATFAGVLKAHPESGEAKQTLAAALDNLAFVRYGRTKWTPDPTDDVRALAAIRAERERLSPKVRAENGPWALASAVAARVAARLDRLDTLRTLARLEEAAGGHAAAAKTLAEIESACGDDSPARVDNARAFSRLAGAARRDPALGDADRRKAAAGYASRALEILRARASSLAPADLKAPDFDAVRDLFPDEWRSLTRKEG